MMDEWAWLVDGWLENEWMNRGGTVGERRMDYGWIWTWMMEDEWKVGRKLIQDERGIDKGMTKGGLIDRGSTDNVV